MTTENKTPGLRIVAGTDGPGEGPESNAAKPRKVRSDAGIPKKPAKAAKAAGEIEMKRAQAYADMEPYLCKVVHMGTIASNLFDCTDRELYDFAVNQVEEMLDELKAHYYAMDFRP
jgi:isopentenyldiphosphate isomerase